MQNVTNLRRCWPFKSRKNVIQKSRETRYPTRNTRKSVAGVIFSGLQNESNVLFSDFLKLNGL